MEILIILCLIVIMSLLVLDKVRTGGKAQQPPPQEKINPDLPDIMGQPKAVKSNAPRTRPVIEKAMETDTAPTDGTAPDRENPSLIDSAASAPVPATGGGINLEEEEGDWSAQVPVPGDDFATGVTFDELATIGKLLAQTKIKGNEKALAVGVASKIEGTELMVLLESNIANVSERIALLLDKSAIPTATGRPSAPDRAAGNFDIADYT